MRNAIVVLLLITGAFMAMRFFGAGGHAGVPPMFSEGLTLAAANSRASGEGKLVLAMATASWCPPCQQMKKGTLRDAGVEAIVRKKYLPVYLDVSDNSSPGVAEAGPLNISGIPAFIVLKDGQEIARTVGAMTAADFSDFLRSAAN